MHFTIIASPRAQHQLQHREAMAEGLTRHGVRVTLSHHKFCKTQFVACWGWRAGKALRKAGHEVLVMERGYLGDRFNWSSLAWNGLNGRGEFAVAPNDNGKRFNDNFSMSPWNKSGEYILIMGQVPNDASLQGLNLGPWYQEMCSVAAATYGLPVMFRQHPVAARKGFKQHVKGAIKSVGDLDQALANAALVITYNSNSAVDAVISGIPAIAADEGSMAWPVVGHSIGEKIYPDRKSWAEQLAWRQWRLSEIADGSALTGLLSMKHGR